MSVGFYLMSEKGYAVLRAVAPAHRDAIAFVVGARDRNVQRDYYDEIAEFCRESGVPFYDRAEKPAPAPCAFAISWRWIIDGQPQLIVLHDSLLPKYRGFAPTVSALINGEPWIGVTALFADSEYDRGDIIAQKRLPARYPLKIQTAIEALSGAYAELVREILGQLQAGRPLPRRLQDEAEATYSLWRDEDDYRIDWSWEAGRVRRFIDSVGYPYSGASTLVNGRLARVIEAEEVDDVTVEGRTPGKVIFVREGEPVVVCGSGLLKITRLLDAETGDALLPLKKFRSRFR